MESGKAAAGDSGGHGDPWRDPYLRTRRHYYEDERGNSASRPILLAEEVADSREQLAAADASADPHPLARVSSLRLLIARDVLQECAARLEPFPENEPLVTLARETAQGLWEAAYNRD